MIHVSKCYYCGDYYDSAERTWLETCGTCEADEMGYAREEEEYHEELLRSSFEPDEHDNISVKWAHEEDDE